MAISKIYEDILDNIDINDGSSSDVITHLSSNNINNDWNDSSYYNMFIMFREIGQNQLNPISQTNTKTLINNCKKLSNILNGTISVDSYSEVFYFYNETVENESLKYPFENPFNREQYSRQAVAIKHNFINLKSLFNFIIKIFKTFKSNNNIEFGKSAPFFIMFSQPNPNGGWYWFDLNSLDDNNHRITIEAREIISFINPDSKISKEEFKEVFNMAKLFMTEEQIYSGFRKYYNNRFNSLVFNFWITMRIEKNHKYTPVDININSISELIGNKSINIQNLVEKTKNKKCLSYVECLNELFVNKDDPFMPRYYSLQEAAEFISDEPIYPQIKVVFLPKQHIIKLFAILGIKKTNDGVAILEMQANLNNKNNYEEAKIFANEINALFGSDMSEDELNTMISEILIYSKH